MAHIDELVSRSFLSAFEELTLRHTGENYRFVKEDVLRYHMAMAVDRDYPDVRVELEWKNVDMLLMGEQALAMVELKSLDQRFRMNLDGTLGAKGGAGSKNFEEFRNSLGKLLDAPGKHEAEAHGWKVAGTYFVLTGTTPVDVKRMRRASDFASDYWPPEKIDLGPGVSGRVLLKISKELGSLLVFGWVMRVDRSTMKA